MVSGGVSTSFGELLPFSQETLYTPPCLDWRNLMNDQPLAFQDYMWVEIAINGLEKQKYKQVETMYLYEDRIDTANDTFPIENVRDLSFRKIGDEGGLFYLHTNKGLYTYTVESSPEAFIRMFKGY